MQTTYTANFFSKTAVQKESKLKEGNSGVAQGRILFEKARAIYPMHLENKDSKTQEVMEENDYRFKQNPELMQFKSDSQKVELMM